MIIRSKAKIKNILLKKKYFIFDFDGVIADSVNLKDKIFFEIFNKDGHEIAKKSLKFHKKNQGKSRFYKIDSILKKHVSNCHIYNVHASNIETPKDNNKTIIKY